MVILEESLTKFRKVYKNKFEALHRMCLVRKQILARGYAIPVGGKVLIIQSTFE